MIKGIYPVFDINCIKSSQKESSIHLKMFVV